MPPKNSAKRCKSATALQNSAPTSEAQKNALTNMFKRIESLDQTLKKCENCGEKIKSCLFKDHLSTKCSARNKIEKASDDEEIVILDEVVDVKQEPHLKSEKKISSSNIEISVSILNDSRQNNPICRVESVEKVEEVGLENDLPSEKKLRRTLSAELDVVTESSNDSEKNNRLINEFLDKNPEIFNEEFKQLEKKSTSLNESMEMSQSQRRLSGSKDFYLENFESAIKSVLDESTFCCLLDDFDFQIIKKFSLLSSNSFQFKNFSRD